MLAKPQTTPVVATLADRYPGAQPFDDTELDCKRFRGRDQESELLLYQLLGADLLALFGKPGLGKTSLLNARLFPLLRKRDFLPLPVRFNQTDPLSPMQVFTAAVDWACNAEGIDYTRGDPGGLWEFFKTAVFWRDDRLQTPVVVLDQFEEIFTLQSEEFRRGVATELGELVSRRLPERLRQRLQSDPPLTFSEEAPDVKVLLSLREEYLGMLQELTPQMPSILQTRFRLTSLNEPDARRAITEPAELVSDEVEFATKSFLYKQETVDEIIDAVRSKEGGRDPFILQIVCSHVEKRVRERQKAKDAPSQVGSEYIGGAEGIRKIVGEFYLDALNRVPGAKMAERVRRLCEEEEGLLTRDGHRRSLLREDIQAKFEVDEQALNILERAALLRSEPRHESRCYEISHDRVAKAIQEKRLAPEVEKRKHAEAAVEETRQVLWRDSDLNRWLSFKANEFALRRALQWYGNLSMEVLLNRYQKTLPSHRAWEESQNDWYMAELYFVREVLKNGIDLRQITTDVYWCLEGKYGRQWLQEVKKLDAYFRWQENGGGWSQLEADSNYFDACNDLQKALKDPQRKLGPAAFEPVEQHLLQYFLNAKRRLDSEKERVKLWIEVKGERQSAASAQAFMKLYYDNIIPAVVGGDPDATAAVVKALGICGTQPNYETMINCFEMIVAVNFLNVELLPKLGSDSAAPNSDACSLA
jgi:hypothetical protein